MHRTPDCWLPVPLTLVQHQDAKGQFKTTFALSALELQLESQVKKWRKKRGASGKVQERKLHNQEQRSRLKQQLAWKETTHQGQRGSGIERVVTARSDTASSTARHPRGVLAHLSLHFSSLPPPERDQRNVELPQPPQEEGV